LTTVTARLIMISVVCIAAAIAQNDAAMKNVFANVQKK
jgi:hypothetical protein